MKIGSISGSLTRKINGDSYIVAGSGITVVSGSDGSVTISSAGGGGLQTVKQYVAPKTTVTSTADLLIGQFVWEPSDYTGLTSVVLRTVISTDGTLNHTGSIRVYNLTSAAYVNLLTSPSTNEHMSGTSAAPTYKFSDNLLGIGTNFDNTQTSIYEVYMSGTLTNDVIVGGVELVIS